MRKMKDSGIEWIGEIPECWNVKRVKAVLIERNETNNPVKSTNILSLTNDRGVIPYEEKGDIGNKSKDDLTSYKLAYPNDIVLNSMNVFIGSVALSDYFGCVSPVYYMLHIRNKQDSIRFYNYLFQTKQLQTLLHGYGNGIMEIRMRIQMSKLNTVLIPVPTVSEQHRISDYLDEKCSAIDRIIKSLNEEKKLLMDLKKSTINEYIWTTGSPSVSLRYYIKKIEQGWSPAAAENVDSDNGWSVLSLSAIKGGKFIFDSCKPIDIHANIPQHLELHNGDFLMTRSNTRELVGDVCLVDNCREHTIFSDLIYRISFSSDISAKYAKYALQSHLVRQQIQEMAKGSSGTMPKISHKSIKQLQIPHVSMKKQCEIVTHLDGICTKIDAVIDKKQNLIHKLDEYKKSLIYEVVTGKKEV